MPVKRMLEAFASDFRAMDGRHLLESIRRSEGRVLCAEVLTLSPPLVDGISNAELAAAMGADLILLNGYDVLQPQVMGFPGEVELDLGWARLSTGVGTLPARVKEWIGRPVGLNLEPIPDPEKAARALGRLATPENARRAMEQGVDFLVITGNPQTGVTGEGIAEAVAQIRKAIGGIPLMLAGKMHRAGADEPVISERDVEAMMEAGADGILIPLPGTVPGVVEEEAARLAARIHRAGRLVMGTIGTSQEGATASVIEQLALAGKRVGVDIFHIGDAGFMGIAFPENIYALSLAIRGRRHTWRRMAASLHR
ncbi:hypothetical protein [Thermoflexus sp.]|nr:hypothetical protein [Thermoflexus sp.]MCX7689859.1 haloacid dehalogenase-like hydrolase [Thermoflexus sp.]MDW8065941.1 haloacid dehalogenase-like hydrolase [Anaerolineae bacterium]MDW8186269.1 haloacid dehalogenase-like hydrolase [Anaerolineae bacterium]